MRTLIFSLSLCASYAQSEDRTLFTEDQLRNCDEYAMEIATYNEMKHDGAPLEAALKIYDLTPHTKELTEVVVKEIYASNGVKSLVLAGYYKATCLNKVVGLEAPALESLKGSYSECESEDKPADVLDCATEITARHSKTTSQESL